jgi:hypothetical protein
LATNWRGSYDGGMSTILPSSGRQGFVVPVVQCFTPDVARKVAELEVSPADQSRVDELAAKANEGQLSPAERLEYEGLIDGMEWLGTVQALARAQLNRPGAP